MKIGIIVGSTRPNRLAPKVALWIYGLASRRADAEFEVIDLADFRLPFLDEPLPPVAGNYTKEHTLHWARKVASFDAFIIVTPEYNYSVPSALKTALDFLYAEWNNKAVAFVSYGAALGVRAVEHLRGIAAQLQMADVGSQVALSLFDDFDELGAFNPRPVHLAASNTMLDQLIGWGKALKRYREETRSSTQTANGARPTASSQDNYLAP